MVLFNITWSTIFRFNNLSLNMWSPCNYFETFVFWPHNIKKHFWSK